METQPIIQYRRSFLAAAAVGASLCIVAFTLCATVVVLYGMRIVDAKTEGFPSLVAAAIKGVPDLAGSLPPVFSDALRDRRCPEYKDKLAIAARVASAAEGRFAGRPVLEIRNTGTSVVSLLSLRVTVLDRNNLPIGTWSPWAATPFAIEDDWPGLLMPGATRYLPACWTVMRKEVPPEEVAVQTEITELRLWEPDCGIEAQKGA